MSDPDRRYAVRRQRWPGADYAVVDRWSADRVVATRRDPTMADELALALNRSQANLARRRLRR